MTIVVGKQLICIVLPRLNKKKMEVDPKKQKNRLGIVSVNLDLMARTCN